MPCFLRSPIISFLATLASRNQEIENLALVVDRTPKPVTISANTDNHLIEVPVIARSRSCPPQFGRDGAAKLKEPASKRFIAHIDAALRQQFLNVAKGELEPGIEPDGVSNDVGWEAVAFVGDWGHMTILAAFTGQRQPS